MAKQLKSGRRVKEPGERGIPGKPTTYRKEVADAILAEIAGGTGPIRAIKKVKEHYPDISPGTFYEWVSCDRDGLRERLETAKAIYSETLLEEIQDIADDSEDDYQTRKLSDGRTVMLVDRDHIARAKLRCDVRFHRLATLNANRPPPGVKADEREEGTVKEAIAALERLARDKAAGATPAPEAPGGDE